MDAVEAAFAALPRSGFLPVFERWRADYDGPISIGHDQTNSQPRTVRDMLDLLDVRRGQRVLDVGAGSGWSTALLAHLTGPSGLVFGVELEPDLAKWGAENVRRARVPWASVTLAQPGLLGAPDHAPYDRILVSAEARSLPEPLIEQLGDPGRMVIPVAGVMTLVVRDGQELEVTEHGYYRFVPLR